MHKERAQAARLASSEVEYQLPGRRRLEARRRYGPTQGIGLFMAIMAAGLGSVGQGLAEDATGGEVGTLRWLAAVAYLVAAVAAAMAVRATVLRFRGSTTPTHP